MPFQDSVEGILRRTGAHQPTSPPPTLLPWWQQQAFYLLLGTEEPDLRGVVDLPIACYGAVYSTGILPSQCVTLDQDLGLVQGKAVTWRGSWPSPSPSGYLWVIWGVAEVEKEGPGPCAAELVPGCIRAAQQAVSSIIPCAQRDLDSASHLWIPKASGSREVVSRTKWGTSRWWRPDPTCIKAGKGQGLHWGDGWGSISKTVGKQLTLLDFRRGPANHHLPNSNNMFQHHKNYQKIGTIWVNFC